MAIAEAIREVDNNPILVVKDLLYAVGNIKLDPTLSVPLYEQICRALRDAILAGDIPRGSKLPTGRELAEALGVGRNTIVAAYNQLVAEGYIISNRRRGTHVTHEGRIFDNNYYQRSRQTTAVQGAKRKIIVDEIISPRVERALSGRESRRRAPILHSFLGPDPAQFPRHQLSKLLSADLCRPFGSVVTSARKRFQQAISTYLRGKRGLVCEPEQIIPVRGIQGALDLATRTIIDPGHNVLLESPSLNTLAKPSLLEAGAWLMDMQSDMHGADPKTARNTPSRMICVTPTIGFPYGRTLAEERRLAILELARIWGAIIVETDFCWELNYNSQLLGPLFGRDASVPVLYCGGLNETLGVQFGVGYLAVPQSLVDPFEAVARNLDYGPDDLVLSFVSSFIEDNQYAAHVRTIRSVYAERLQQIMKSIHLHMGQDAAVQPVGGYHVTLPFDGSNDEWQLCDAALQQGILAAPLSDFNVSDDGGRGLVVNFGVMADRSIDTHIRRLGQIIGGVDKRR